MSFLLQIASERFFQFEQYNCLLLNMHVCNLLAVANVADQPPGAEDMLFVSLSQQNQCL